MNTLERTKLIIIDDWGPSCSPPINVAICSRSSMIATTRDPLLITSQVPVSQWHDASPIRPSVTRSWTASSTMLLGSTQGRQSAPSRRRKSNTLSRLVHDRGGG